MAGRTSRYNKLESDIDIVCGDIKEAADIFGAASFNVVTSNPPYMIGEHGLQNPYMPKAIARHEILCTLEDVASQASRVLKDRGYKFQLNLMSLHGIYGRRAAQVSHCLLKNGYYDYVGSDLHWLGVYEDTVEHLLLTRTEQQQLKALLENNHSLW